ncbi:hypothetical protein VB712_04070 [Spirulina sp. CCNP1310]|uniref:DUF7682 family zinc-binding protein n=1 Tax=Spirulina sp. CCNP1310 TaxID=3110249 RepID=UPI002B20EF4F|nr:hypothetical protein [Spirulina sp. CCNP1310]MEA5418389.1 hypothetical protein [Spirulina sp. CCNP1310]
MAKAKRRKLFPCGHRGQGQVCHRCAQEAEARNERQSEKAHWLATFREDVIDLTHLPKNVVLKARQIINGLQEQQDYRRYKGKRLRHNRFVISIPVTRHYRLLCRDHGSLVVPEAVISHEDYNVCKPGG